MNLIITSDRSLGSTLVDWINTTLKPEHIVVQSLEEDLYDGLVLHHLLCELAGVHLPVEEIALSSAAQIRKLELILEELNKHLGPEDDSKLKWNFKVIHNKDLLATIHLLVAMVNRFQPELNLPPNVKVEVVVVEVGGSGIKSRTEMEVLTDDRKLTQHVDSLNRNGGSDSLGSAQKEDPIDQLLKLEVHKVNTVKQAILHFINQKVSNMGLQVVDMDTQFADGVILLLLIGQLEGFFIPLHDFTLTPCQPSERLHNVTLAFDLLRETGFEVPSVSPQGEEIPLSSIQ
uniref:Parvin, gamma n=1 Tax=Tetraodon nigroviridis TaxID=99883 RepID=H3DEW5_TETNG